MIWQDLRLYRDGAGPVAQGHAASSLRVTSHWYGMAVTVDHGHWHGIPSLRYGSGCYPDSGYCRRFSSSGSSAGHRRSRPGPVLRLRVSAVTARSGEICRPTRAGRGGAGPDRQASVTVPSSVAPTTVTIAVRSIRSWPPGQLQVGRDGGGGGGRAGSAAVRPAVPFRFPGRLADRLGGSGCCSHRYRR